MKTTFLVIYSLSNISARSLLLASALWNEHVRGKDVCFCVARSRMLFNNSFVATFHVSTWQRGYAPAMLPITFAQTCHSQIPPPPTPQAESVILNYYMNMRSDGYARLEWKKHAESAFLMLIHGKAWGRFFQEAAIKDNKRDAVSSNVYVYVH